MPSVFFEMLRSLIALGETRNLSQAVSQLGVTRQTIRRHIRELERLKGETLFEIRERQYRLTPAGELAMADSLKLIENSEAWLIGSLATAFELLSTAIEIDDNSWMYAQQHRLIDMWSMAPPILRRGAEAWTLATGMLEHEAIDQIRPYVLVYRKYRGEWLVVEIGEKSAYRTWLGLSLAKSELGRGLDLGEKYAPMIDYWRKPYQAALQSGGLWYEHLCVSMPRHRGEAPVPVNYQKLVAACKFADGEPAVLVFAARTDRINIPHVPQGRFVKNLPENLMEFEI